MLLCLLLGACSPQVRMMKEPPSERLPDHQWAATTPAGLTVTVHTVLVPNGPGSWVRDADWDEFIVTIRNLTPYPLSIETLRLESPWLPAPRQSSLSLKELEDRTKETLRTARDFPIVAGEAAVLGATATAASTGALVPFAAAPLAVAPLVSGFIEYPLDQALERHHLEHEDHAMIELTILERGAHLALELPSGQEVRRSVFFALTPGPSRLLVGYRIADQQFELPVPLPALAQLHLKPGTALH